MTAVELYLTLQRELTQRPDLANHLVMINYYGSRALAEKCCFIRDEVSPDRLVIFLKKPCI